MITLCQLNELRFQSKVINIELNIYISSVGSGSLLCRVLEKRIYFDFRVNYLYNHEVERPIKKEFVIENLNIYEIQKQTCELSQITMLTRTIAKEMVNKNDVF